MQPIRPSWPFLASVHVLGGLLRGDRYLPATRRRGKDLERWRR